MSKLSAFVITFVVVAMSYTASAYDPCKEACNFARITDGDSLTNLIKGGADVCNCICDDYGNYVLHLAVPSQCIVCANALINHGYCNVDPRNYNGDTPLHTAASICQSPMLNVLLDFHADPNAENYAYNTPMCLAALSGNENCGGIVNDLTTGGADICKKCNWKTPFEICNNSVVCDIIKDNGGDQCH